jgi:putative transposase
LHGDAPESSHGGAYRGRLDRAHASSAPPAGTFPIERFPVLARPTRPWHTGWAVLYSTSMPSPHRKRKKTYNIPNHAHFLTFSCFRQYPLLARDRSRQWFIDALEEARVKFDLMIWAYVIMLEHVHLLIRPRQPTYRIEHILAAIKRPVSVAAREYLASTGRDEWLHRLTICRGGREVFRFWKPGGGFDHNLWNDRPVLATVAYMHDNPVRRGLVLRAVDWRWSSARSWAGLEDCPIKIDALEF